MSSRYLSWVVAVDGGTTNTRARLLHDGRVMATARRAIGVRDVASSSQGAGALGAAVRDAIREVIAAGGGVRPDAVVAAGMLTSEVGLASVPHAVAPAGIEELARASVFRELPDVADVPMLLVPGVLTPPGQGPDGWAEGDVMRGEECETLGALALRGIAGPTAFLWPGSHTKLVDVDGRGRIVRSHTTLAGEMTAALARHTLLAANLPETLPLTPDPAALAAGAREAARSGLGRAAFLVRVAALSGALTPERRAAFWVGAVVGDDAEHLARHPILKHVAALTVGGSRPLREIYAEFLAARLGGPVSSLNDDDAESASAVGALKIARLVFGQGAPSEFAQP